MTLNNPLSFKSGLNKLHYVILAVIVILSLFFLFSSEDELYPEQGAHVLTPAVLEALRTQNLDKRLEYAESQPIIESLTKYLHLFEYYIKTNPTKARGYLSIIKTRFDYLEYKDLKVDQAEKILYDAINKADKEKQAQ